MVSRVVRERELNLVASAAERLSNSAGALKQLAHAARGESKHELGGVAERVEKLHRLSMFALGVLKALVALRPVQPSTILKVANLAVGAGSPFTMWGRQ
jgi:hypothetical protein